MPKPALSSAPRAVERSRKVLGRPPYTKRSFPPPDPAGRGLTPVCVEDAAAENVLGCHSAMQVNGRARIGETGLPRLARAEVAARKGCGRSLPGSSGNAPSVSAWRLRG